MVDTQIMAAFLVMVFQLAFAALVSEFVGVDLDKSESRTDWLAPVLFSKATRLRSSRRSLLDANVQQASRKSDGSGWWEAAQQESDLQVAKRIRKATRQRLPWY